MTSLRRGTNLSRVAGFNEAVVIDAVRRAGNGLSRVEISEQTGLSAQTVSNITRRMLESGLLLAGAPLTSGGMGKPRVPLLLNPAGRFAVGVHLDPLTTTVVLLDLCGQLVDHQQWATVVGQPPREALAEIAERIPQLIAGAAVDPSDVAGIGFASPGPVSSAFGTVIDPPHLPAWRDVPIVSMLTELTGMHVELDKDVIAALVGERWAGQLVGQANCLFLYLGTGIGLGLANEDAVVRGATGNAGDIGHLVLDDGGPPCPCGLRGCIGVTLSPAGLVQQAVQAGALGTEYLAVASSGDPVEVDRALRRFATAAARGEPAAVEVVATATRYLAKAVATLANVLDTDALVLGGPTWSVMGEALGERLPELLEPQLVRRSLGTTITLTSSSLGDDVIAVGAACLVLDHAFSPALRAIALQG